MIVKNPPVSNDRDAFDYIVEHLKRQDCKAVDTDEAGAGCQYRVEEFGQVLKCAVGALISKSAYGEDLEDRTIHIDGLVYSAVSGSNPYWVMTQDSVDMLSALQRFHDEVEVSDWSWLFDVVGKAIEQFGFENVAYNANGYQRSALCFMVSVAVHGFEGGDSRLGSMNSSEVTLDWFNNEREKTMGLV